jgi:putative transposase
MVRYRRNFVPGGTWFFTATLADRRSTALVDHIDALHSAFRAARRASHFAIDAIVVLPDHLHAILTLPSNDADFPGRWRRIKGNFSNALIGAGLDLERWPNGDLALWQRRFWEHTIRDDGDFARHVDYIHFNPVKHDWRGGCATGRIRRFTDTSGKAGCRTIGQATSARAQQISESRARRRSPHERGDVRATYASKPPRISLRSSGLRLLFCEKWQFQNKVRLRLAIHIIKMSGLGLLRR